MGNRRICRVATAGETLGTTVNRRQVLLVNPNRMRPPVGPLGLEYLAEVLAVRGYEPVLCDLAFAEDWRATLAAAVATCDPLAIGISVRNLDDAYFASQDFILAKTAEIGAEVMALTDAPVVLGGVGFSVAPREVLRFVGAPYGIAGDGEVAFPCFLDRLTARQPIDDIPGIVFRRGENEIVSVPREPFDLSKLPYAARKWAEVQRYQAEGGQAGVETKRGCDAPCIYCVDPVAKEKQIRFRPVAHVVAEFRALLEQGVTVIHLCDSEFNLPPEHACALCDALATSGLGGQVQWYTYACPVPFDDDLARAMARAGCVGVNFGVDHGDDRMLRRLGRRHRCRDIMRAVEAARRAGLRVMLDVLLGGPGETQESLARGIAFLRGVGAHRVGLSCGVRIYPNTPLARWVFRQGNLTMNPNLHGCREDNADLLRPVFFVDAGIEGDIHDVVDALVGDDPLFLFANPNRRERNYNYNNNTLLERAIRAGARGAYWDILARLGSEHLP